tara:strand:+ start:144 stop:1319 length:1176 start_codon:yes stop_codon:yes gene_type:complete
MGARSTGSHPTTTKADGHLLEYSRNTFVEGGGALAAPSNPISASGGNSTNTYTDNGKQYKAHIFTGSGTFVVDRDAKNFPSDVEYLVIAGGGGGGGLYQGGGGGAGGIRTNLSGHPLATGNPSFPVTTTGGNGSGSYTVTIGGGGAGATVAGNNGTTGQDSYFGPPSAPAGITSKGGGGAGGFEKDGLPGGSGGGAGDKGGTATGGYGYNPTTPDPITPSIPSPHPYGITQGNNGGTTSGPYSSPYGAGGGGGAGGTGQGINGGSLTAYDGNGGIGSQVLIAGPSSHPGVGAPGPNGQEQWYCGGGGGGGYAGVPGTSGDGGAGTATNAPTSGWSGGGPGGPNGTGAGGNGVSGSTNSGGGGGGAVSPGPPYSGNGGAGGSGIVIIRYEFQ